MKNAYSTRELQSVLALDVSTVTRRAQREGWPSRKRSGRGGGFEFPLSTLPKDVRTKIQQAEAKAAPAAPVTVNGAAQPIALDEVRKRKAAAKLDLMGLYGEWLLANGRSAAQRQAFITAYQSGAWPVLLEIIGPQVSWKSIERWKVAIRRGGNIAAVADKRGLCRRGQRNLNETQRQTLIRCCLQAQRPLSEAYREANKLLAFEGQPPIGSEATARRFIMQDWVSENFGDWTYVREGEKAWNDKCAFFIERDYSLIEVGDIVVADGHKLNFEIINPETGKAQRMELVLWYDMKSNFPLGWEILPSENTQCIAAAFRRACLMLGKYPKVAYLDNGRAFRSKYFNGVDMRQTGVGGLFKALGVQPLFAWPYHGQSKTVERFFGSFAELERWAPSYSGTSIATKPPRMMRGEKTHVDIYKKSGARPLTIPEAHVAIAMFFDEYVTRGQRGHLAGEAPLDTFLAGRGPGLGEAQLMQLRDLMLTKTLRTLNRNGVSVMGKNYYSPELYNRRHQVEVRYDPQLLDDAGDVAHVLVYDSTGNYLCRADRVRGIHPAASILGDASHQRDFKAAISLKHAQKQQASTMARTLLTTVVLPETAERMRVVEVKDAAPVDHEPKPLTQTKIQAIEAAKHKATAAKANTTAYIPPAQRQDITTELERYEYLFGLAVRDGLTLRDADQEWMRQYEATDEYRDAAAPRFERLRLFYQRKQAQA
ncbi:MAG: Mu transposase C-terminal domain-containing protein [Proteobacteria bacterium]|nr:Mu transposase C-terminal domain-containing protein [Pseudomonadota bacterium]